MKLSDFDFDLPEALIATRPAQPRSASRLLVAHGGRLTDSVVRELPDFLRPGDRLVLNDTRVIPARLLGERHRSSARGAVAARLEVTLLEPAPDGTWRALVKPLKKLKDGEVVVFSDSLSARMRGRDGNAAVLEFNLSGEDFDAALAAAGAMPLPPYIAARRAPDEQDKEDYQTIWARAPGAVAAPTASLHFDNALMAALERRGIAISYVTLHVGAGTFLPVKVDDIANHVMHAERGEITAQAAHEIAETRARGGRIIPVGTTAMRLLETAAAENGQVAPWCGATDIFITPGFRFRACDALMTNFHLPKSTLMMLVSAFLGTEEIRALYAHAVAERYRFFSYGDASLLIPDRRGGG